MPLGGGALEAGETYRETSYVDRVEAVDILPEVDCLDNFLLGDVRREGKLHDEAVDLRVAVEPVYGVEQCLLVDVILEADESRAESALFAGFTFEAT